MPDHSFHLAQGTDDYNTIAGLWPKQWGAFDRTIGVQRTVSDAMNSGSAFIVRRPDNTPVGAVVLDLETYPRTTFVPFLLVGGDPAEGADITQRLLGFVVNTMMLTGSDRLLFMRTASPQRDQAVKQFAAIATQRKFPATIEILGNVHDLFGDGRTVTIHSLFIPAASRPDLLKRISDGSQDVLSIAATLVGPDAQKMVTAMRTIVGGTMATAAGGAGPKTAAKPVGGGGGTGGTGALASSCCSGCGEKDGKDGDKHDKKDDAPSMRLDPARAQLNGLLAALPKLNVQMAAEVSAVVGRAGGAAGPVA